MKERRTEIEARAQATRVQLAEEVEKVVSDPAAGVSPDGREVISVYHTSLFSSRGTG